MDHRVSWVSHTPDNLESTQSSEPQDKLTRTPPPTPSAPAPDASPSRNNLGSVIDKFFRPIKLTSPSREEPNQINSTTLPSNRRVIFPPLAQSSSHRSDISLQTQSFASAAEELSLHSSEDDELSIEEHLFQNDLFAQEDIIIMSNSNKRRNKTAKIAPITTTTAAAVDADVTSMTDAPATPVLEKGNANSSEQPHFDTLDHVYEGVKSAWAFGKNIGIVKPFLGMAESVAVKVIQITTGVESLDALDQNLKPHVSGLDKDLLDPAILAVIKFLEPILGKGSEVVGGMVNLVHKVPLIKTDPEVTSPEVFTPASEDVVVATTSSD